MRNICNPQAKIVSLLLLLLGLFFFPFSPLVYAETALNLVSINGLVFTSIPEFSTVDFTYNRQEVRTISITEQKHTEVSLTSYVFADTPTPTPSPTETPETIPSPTPSEEVISSPTQTPSPTPSPTVPPILTNTPTPAVATDDIWDKIAACESNGNWTIDTGNGYFGGLQFSDGAWQAVGGSGKASDASREEQIDKGKKLQAIRGWGAWGDCAKKLHLTN